MAVPRIEYIAKMMGKKLVQSFYHDRSSPSDLLCKIDKAHDKVLNQPVHVWEKEHPNVTIACAIDILDFIKMADPTPNLQYLQWITKRYTERDFGCEDLERVKDELEMFERFKPRFRRDNVQLDINKYKSAAEVFTLLQQYKQQNEAPSKKEEVRREEDRYFIENKAELFYRGETLKVIIPKTQQASCFFGKGTRWCTAASQSYNAFHSYNNDGPLYVIMTPKGKYQFHFPSQQFMNELDRSVHLPDLIRQYPELKDAFDKIATDEGFLPLMKKVSPDGLYNALVKCHQHSDQGYFQEDQYSLAGLLQMVDKNAQDERIALFIVGINPSVALKFIRPELQSLPSFQRIVVEKRPELLQSINPKAQDAELVTAVVKKSPAMLRYVRPDLMTSDLLIMAVQQQPEVLGQVPRDKQSIEVITAAFKATKNMNVKRMLINMVHDKSLQKQLVETLRKAA